MAAQELGALPSTPAVGADRRWIVEEDFQAGRAWPPWMSIGYGCWTSWYQRVTLAMLALACPGIRISTTLAGWPARRSVINRPMRTAPGASAFRSGRATS